MKRTLSLLLALCMVISLLCLPVLAVEITEKPANGTTEGQPFPIGAGGSNNFRIPGIVTLNDGTLIAACDARWNHTGDGAGLDTIVAVSHDNGATWEHTFANYLGDNGNTYNNLSTCIIDPAIGTDGETAYLIADLFPAGIALNTSRYSPIATENGFDDAGHLLLRALADDTVAIGYDGYNTMAGDVDRYDYYLDLETLQLYTIGVDGTEDTLIEGYTVDAYFNIVSDDGTVNTNLFFSDSPYQPYPTDYLYLVTSTDGLTWSEPTLLNLQEDGEQTLLIGPGNGTYDAATDRMIFTAYEYTSGYQRTSLLWKNSDGNWTRTADATGSTWSSEATSVVLADGTVRCFYRDAYSNLRYTDYLWDEAEGNYVPDTDAYEVTTLATKTYNNQISAIKYSEQIDGKDAILVSTANTSTNARRNGTLYVFLVDEDNSMELAYKYDMFDGTDDYYAYSCITEMDDGNIALLYEGDDGGSGYGRVIFDVINIDDVVTRDNDARLSFTEFELLTGDTATYTDNSGYYGDADLSELDTAVATVEISGSETVTDAARLGSDATYSGDYIDLGDCLYTFAQDENGYWIINSGDIYLNTNGNTGYPHGTDSCTFTIEAGYEDGTFYIRSTADSNTKGDANYLYFDRAANNWNRVNNLNSNTTWMTNCSMSLFRAVEGDGSGEIPGYERITSLDELTAGEYLIGACANDGSWYVAYPSTVETTRYNQIAKVMGRTTVGYTELTFTGVGAGYTEVQIGSTVYKITVADLSTVDVTVPVGESVTVTEPNGNYEDADTSALDTSIATVALAGSDGTNASGVSLTPATALTDGTYVILNTRANKLVNNTSASAGAAAGTMAGFSLSGTTSTFDASTAIWTITAVEGGYTVQDTNGQYMTIGANAGGLSDEAQVLTVVYANGTWTLMQNDAYLNDAGGAGTTASGWQNSAAATDVGSQFTIYAYSTEQGTPCTDVTFTGVYPGATSVIIGRTQYNVTVTGEVVNVDLGVGERETYIIDPPAYQLDVDPDESVAYAGYDEFAAARLGTDATYSGEYVDLADCLYTFTANEDGTYVISSTDAEGNTVYLEGYASTNGYPNVTYPTNITVADSSVEGTVTLCSTSEAAGKTGYLFFWRDGKNYFDRVTTTTNFEAGVSFHLYTFDGEAYEAISGADAIVSGEQYLIVAETDTAVYVAYPTTSNATRYAQAGRLCHPTTVTFIGAAEGETTARAGSTIYEITVGAHTEHDYEFAGVSFAEDYSWGKAHFICSICGDEVEYDAEVVITREEPTCTEWGKITYTAVYGEYSEGEIELIAPTGHDYVDGVCTVCGEVDPDTIPEPEVVATGWSGYTIWTLTDDGVLTFSPSGQTLAGQCNLRNYWKVDGVLTLPWGEYADMITTVVIADGIHDIGQMAFYALPNLETVTLGKHVVEIRGYAFKNCVSLTTVTGGNLDYICEGAFYGCVALTEIEIPEDCEIGDWAFTNSGVTLN